MIFPFSLRSAENWLDFVPRFLLSISEDSPWIDHDEFLQYLATKLQEYFIPSPDIFGNMILTVLQTATDAGKFVLIQVLLRSVATWQLLAEDSRLQPLLTELALSSDEIYSKAATELSSRLEEIYDNKGESIPLGGLSETSIKSVSLKEKVSFTPDSLSTLWDESGNNQGEKEMEEESDDMVETMRREAPTSPPKLPSPPPSSTTPRPPAHMKPPGAPASPKSSAPPPGSAIPALQPSPAPISVRSRGTPKKKKKKGMSIPIPPPLSDFPIPEPSPDISDPSPKEESFLSSQLSTSSDEFVADMLSPAPEPDALPTSEEDEASPRTIHTHLHYFSRMNPRKTYPFTVTISSRAKEVMRDKTHFTSGEQETEIRGEFQLIEPTRQLHVEPLLSGCLVQPTYQRVDLESRNFPKELEFFVTPLVDPGLRATTLTGKIYFRNERGTLLQEMTLPKLSVSSHRTGQAIASLGTLLGGTLPALDFLFGVNLQATLAAQLAYVLPALADTIPMDVVVIALEVFVFLGALALGGLWWLRKGRAKLAPTHKGALNLPS